MTNRKVTIKIGTENAAFETDAGLQDELARILRKLADDLEAGRYPLMLLDINGNRVGDVCYEI